MVSLTIEALLIAAGILPLIITTPKLPALSIAHTVAARETPAATTNPRRLAP